MSDRFTPIVAVCMLLQFIYWDINLPFAKSANIIVKRILSENQVERENNQFTVWPLWEIRVTTTDKNQGKGMGK